MATETWSAILIALVSMIMVAGGVGFLVLRHMQKSPAFGWLALAVVLALYASLVIFFAGVSYVELPIVPGIKAGLLSLVIVIISTRFWRPVAAT